MITYPVSQFLKHFGVEEQVSVPVAFDDLPNPLVPVPEEPEIDPSTLLEAAREEGWQAGRAAAQAEFDAILENQANEHLQHLAAERDKWLSDESAALDLKLTAALTQFAEQLAEKVDAVLRPFIIGSVRQQIVDELVSAVHVLLAGDENPAIVISGASDLLEKLQTKLAATPAIEYRPNDSVDVHISAQNTIIESRLQTWIERFEMS
jgi:hypothetical protein